MARINFPPIVAPGQTYKDDNGTVWVVDNRRRWARSTRTGGDAPLIAPADQIWYAKTDIEQIALASKAGDICVRTDKKPNQTYKQRTNTNTAMSDWQAMGHVGLDMGLLT